MEENILIEYLKGTLNEDSCGKVEEWVSLSDENKKIMENLYVLLFVSDRITARNEINVNKEFSEFERNRKTILKPAQKTKTISFWRRIAGVAAVFIAVLISGAFVTLTLLEKNAQSTIVATRLGERAQVTLPDGSKVWLNACSSLEYKKSFFSRKRGAKLNGEAYFEVAHNKTFPFIVSSGNSEIKVLGTKFNIRGNDDENYLSATLVEGSILFSEAEANLNVKLKPGEELIFDKTTRQYRLKNLTNPQEILGWMNGKLLFENASLEEIAKDLERHYNVHIRFSNEKVKKERFNAEFEMADNIYQILSILELTNKFTYKIDKREVIISSK